MGGPVSAGSHPAAAAPGARAMPPGPGWAAALAAEQVAAAGLLARLSASVEGAVAAAAARGRAADPSGLDEAQGAALQALEAAQTTGGRLGFVLAAVDGLAAGVAGQGPAHEAELAAAMAGAARQQVAR